MKKLCILGLLVLLAAPAAGQTIIDLPLNDGTVPSYFTVEAGMSVGSETEGGDTYVKTWDISEGTDWPGVEWFNKPEIALMAANGGVELDASAPGATMEFDIRYVQVGTGDDGTEPYYIFSYNSLIQFRLVSGDGAGNYMASDYLWDFDGWEAQGAWRHVTIDLADTASKPSFQLENLTFLWLKNVAANGRHRSEDHIDMMNFKITAPIIPEPSVLLLAGFGLLALWRRRKK
jgi:hypothetical protein